MKNRDAVMDYILECLRGMVTSEEEIRPDSDLVDELGLESIKVMDLLMMLEDRFDIPIPINILLDIRTPGQLRDALLPHLEKTYGPL
ncbi:acyl carrier protein [Erwinia sorbitola]|uniref:Acyl carrier protein n=1 Tax=Erwinia sorbitola TaxID=2681984 RepID=A0A6I6F054_9GAMM|nr:acyl carrier protein [Erwinia sorbitola]MTD26186.1 acyl carrier protein [Erwinia sorbitola]QGU87280.1 acyl carrier protein [Erwinia sorbitola]